MIRVQGFRVEGLGFRVLYELWSKLHKGDDIGDYMGEYFGGLLRGILGV